MNYKAYDVENYLKQYEHLVTHVIVAHTHFRPYNCTKQKIELMQNEAKKNMQYALNCFASSIHKNHTNLPKRKPHQYRPLTFTTIENIKPTTDKAQTIHFNICLGNLPKNLSTTLIDIHFRYAWVVKAKQKNDIFTESIRDYPSNPQKFFSYIVKDSNKNNKLIWETNGTWDVMNTWLPNNAMYTD